MRIEVTKKPLTLEEMYALTGGGCVYHSNDVNFRIMSASPAQVVEVDRVVNIGNYKFGLRGSRTSVVHGAYDYIGFLIM